MADLSRLTPPGYDWERERTVFRTALIVSAIAYLAIFLVRYAHWWSECFYRGLDGTLYCQTEGFPAFPTVSQYNHAGFLLTAVLAAVQAWHHRLYFRTGSRGDYTMRRLGKPMERHVRVWAVPVLVCALGALSFAVLRPVCYGLYLLMTPDRFTPMHTWWMIWS